MKNNTFNVTAYNQRLLILDWLKQKGGLTTFQARETLGVPSPAPRILELRRQGHKITTHWVTELDSLGQPHRIGCYVLKVQIVEGGENVH